MFCKICFIADLTTAALSKDIGTQKKKEGFTKTLTIL